MDKDKKSFCVESFISNEETPVITVDDLEVTVTDIKNGVVIGTVNLPSTASTPFVPLQWDLTGKVIEEGKAIAESKLNLVFKELSGKDCDKVGKDMFLAISGIQECVEDQRSEDNQRRKSIARRIMRVVSGFIYNDNCIIERRRRDEEKAEQGIDPRFLYKDNCSRDVEQEINNSWVTVDKPEWNWEKYEYRVKSRPYTQEEFVRILRDGRSPFVENKASGDVILIGSIQSTGVHLVEQVPISFSTLLEEYLWPDGSTCGVELVD